ncbi:hypothetical protein Tco_0019337 [Tanacetum coccineum]
MPLSTYLNLGLGELDHTRLKVELADRTVKYPKGIAENVQVGIGKFTFPIDFIILDMPEDVKITLRVGEEKIIFKSVKPASSIVKRIYMLSLKERMELDLEARLMRETLVLNRSLDPFSEYYIELNDLNEPFELRRNQGDDLMPTIEEGEVIEEFRTWDGNFDTGIDDYPSYCDDDKKIHIDPREGNIDEYPIRRIHQGRYGVSVPALTKDHKRNEDQYAVSRGLNTPYSRYGINIIFWKISNVVPTPRNPQYAVSNTWIRQPSNIKEAMADHNWIEAMQEEIHEFERQEEGIDFKESYAPIACFEALRMFLAYATRKELLKKHGIDGCDTTGTPMATTPKVDADLQGTPIYQTKYRSMIGGLMYLTTSIPDIVFATFFCALSQARPTEKHLKEVKRIFRYLKNTIHMVLWYLTDSGFELTVYSNVDHGGCLDTFRSTSRGA